MKKLIFFLLISFSLNGQNNFGNFKTKNNKIIWQKVYKKSFDIKSQNLKLRALDFSPKLNFWIKSIRGAKLIVEKKNNQTRLFVIDIYSIRKYYFTFGWFFGIEQNVTPNYIEEKYLIKNNFSEKFVKKDARIIDKIIQNEINFITSLNEDDW